MRHQNTGRQLSRNSAHREALMHNIAYYTTVAGAKAVVDSIVALKKQELGVKALQDYLVV